MLERLTTGLEFQTQGLVLRAERQRLLASNIANADTPGYQARDFDFARALRAASGGTPPVGQAVLTHGAHLGAQGGAGALLQSTQQFALQAQTNLDGNGVDMDRERASFADNALKYEATLRFLNGSVRTTLDAMRSHNAAV